MTWLPLKPPYKREDGMIVHEEYMKGSKIKDGKIIAGNGRIRVEESEDSQKKGSETQ